MTDIPFGVIVLTDFPFTDLSSSKRRPALVVSADNGDREDVIVVYITSVLRTLPNAILLEPTTANGLKTKSLVRFDKIATLDKSIIAGRLGSVDSAWLTQHRDAFFAVFGFGLPA